MHFRYRHTQIHAADGNCSSPKVYLHYSFGEPCVYPRFQHLVLQMCYFSLMWSRVVLAGGWGVTESCSALESALYQMDIGLSIPPPL